MDGLMFLILVFLGFIGGIFSGWLGIGGGILMVPLLLYVPPFLNIGQLDMKEVAGLTMAQGFFAALSGAIVHGRHRFISKRLVLYMGSSIIVGSLTGSILSKFVSGSVLLAIFAALALVAAVLMFLPKKEDWEGVNAEDVDFNKPLAISIPLFLGFLLGMVGQGGAFILVPVMLYILRIPTRITIGSSLGIILFSASAGFLGKLSTGQVPLLFALTLVTGAMAGAQIGAHLSQGTETRTLRLALACIIAFTALRMTYDLFLGR